MAPYPANADELFQHHILQGVSRTFALTIPQLPPELHRAVANAYLLCRIADTLEDDSKLSFDQKLTYCNLFVDIVNGSKNAHEFSSEIPNKLGPHTSAAEKELIARTETVIRITHSLNTNQREAMLRCVTKMTEGMILYQGAETLNGLENQNALDRYCYYVAGVVGEMLTHLFCDYCSELKASQKKMLHLSVSFGQGLQMTNILKDIWTDRERGACWLPADEFRSRGIVLSELNRTTEKEAFQEVLGSLIGVAHGHLDNALTYTLMLPRSEVGIRRFCLWALGMAVLNLRKINANRSFSSGSEVKITRTAVKATIATTSLCTRSNLALKTLFQVASAGLPKYRVETPMSSIADIIERPSSQSENNAL